jgi:hypothetical protein
MLVREYDFRDLFGKVSIIKDVGSTTIIDGRILPQGDSPAGADAYLAFGYIDYTRGLNFMYLAPANYESGQQLGHLDEAQAIIVRPEVALDCEAKLVELSPEQASEFTGYCMGVLDGYSCSEEVEKIREIREIDPLREPGWPDDIRVALHKEGLQGEGVYVRLTRVADHHLQGTLLNQPYQDFGVGMDDTVDVYLGENEGEVYAVAIVEAPKQNGA